MNEFRQTPGGLGCNVVYRKPLSVGKVAKICSVCNKTVLNWIYHDALKCFRTLGGQYRIWPGDLKEFLDGKAMDIPFRYVEDRQTTFLLVVNNQGRETRLTNAICQHYPDADIIRTNDLYEAFLVIGERKPQVLIMDLNSSTSERVRVLNLLSSRKEKNQMKVIVLSESQGREPHRPSGKNVVDEFWETSRTVEHCMATSSLFSTRPCLVAQRPTGDALLPRLPQTHRRPKLLGLPARGNITLSP